MMPNESESERGALNPFEVPPEERESIEGKVALEAIPSMRRWTGYEQTALRAPMSAWMKVALVVGAGFVLGAAVVAALRLS